MRCPVLFVCHGAGPMPLMNHPTHQDHLRTWAARTPVYQTVHAPGVTAIVVVSAHYETDDGSVLVMADESPNLLFDYSGFPAETYQYVVPNPGSADLANTIVTLLNTAKIMAQHESGRGHDHGTFVPLIGLDIAKKRPTLPVVSVSIRGPADYRGGHKALTQQHLEMGRALAPLRDQGVLILGSGNSVHARVAPADASAFNRHLQGLAKRGPKHFEQWTDHPSALKCHTRPDHALPLLVCAGAAGNDQVQAVSHNFMGFDSSHFIFSEA